MKGISREANVVFNVFSAGWGVVNLFLQNELLHVFVFPKSFPKIMSLTKG